MNEVENLYSKDEIVTAKTIACRDRCKSVLDWIRKAAARFGVQVKNEVCKQPVVARIDHGRWIADCECKGAEYVDPDEPIFFCLSCLNTQYGGALRPVIFPDAGTRKRIVSNLKAKNFYSWNESEEPSHGI